MGAEALTFRSAGASSGGVTFHTGDWVIESLDLGTPAYRDELVSSADSDGVASYRVAKRDAVEFTIVVRLAGPAASKDAVLEKLRTLEAALASAESAYAAGITDPGLDAARLIWKPADSTVEGILPVIRAEISERPIVVQGEGVGWFLNMPVITITGLRDPFIYGPLTAGSPANQTGSPLAQVVDIPAIGGSVPPWVRVLIEDTVGGAGQARNQITMGLESPAQTADLIVLPGAGKLDPAGLAGMVSSGRLTCTSTEWVGAGQVQGDHRGRYRVVASNVKGAGSIRLRWGVTGQAMTLNVEQLSDGSLFKDLDLGAISVDRDTGGSWTGVIETTGTVSLAGLILVPLATWISAETAPGSSAVGTKVVDGTPSGTGELNGSAMTLGGSWSATAGKWTRASGGVIQRTGVSDSAPEIALAGTGTYAGVRFSATVQTGLPPVPAMSEHGLVLRYSSPTNFAALRIVGVMSGGTPRYQLRFDLTVSGFTTTVFSVLGIIPLIPYEPICLIDPQGNWQVWVRVAFSGFQPQILASGQHPAFAAGGALASGRVGLIDRWGAATANTRRYTNITAHGIVGQVQPLLPAKQGVEITPAQMVTIDGADRRRVSPRGGIIAPPPDQASRLLIASRRFNGMAMTETEGKTDNQRVTISTRKRWLQVP